MGRAEMLVAEAALMSTGTLGRTAMLDVKMTPMSTRTLGRVMLSRLSNVGSIDVSFYEDPLTSTKTPPYYAARASCWW